LPIRRFPRFPPTPPLKGCLKKNQPRIKRKNTIAGGFGIFTAINPGVTWKTAYGAVAVFPRKKVVRPPSQDAGTEK
jgi:hypothetical protein